MSRLRNRNIRTKILTVAKWGQNYSQMKHYENGTSTAPDSGIATEIATNKQQPPSTTRYNSSNWDLREHDDEDEPPDDDDDDHQTSDDSVSNHSASSVNTLKVLNEIRNLQDSVKTNSAESYNSWAEDYESDATELVKAEYERMERVLQCREAIPPNYDKEEYKLWIKTFPCLSLVSRSSALKPSTSSPKFCDINTTPTPTPSSTHSRTSSRNLRALNKLIDDLHPSNTIHQTQTTRDFQTTTFSNSKDLAINNTINPRTLNIKVDHSFLQLAPLNIPIKRQSLPVHISNKYQHNKHKQKMSASSYSGTGRTVEWLKDVQSMNEIRRTSTTHTGINDRYRPRRKSSKTDPMKSSSEFIVLPPIEGKEMRSASAATITSIKMPVMLQHPVYPLYENDKESDHNDGFVSYRHRKRKYK